MLLLWRRLTLLRSCLTLLLWCRLTLLRSCLTLLWWCRLTLLRNRLPFLGGRLALLWRCPMLLWCRLALLRNRLPFLRGCLVLLLGPRLMLLLLRRRLVLLLLLYSPIGFLQRRWRFYVAIGRERLADSHIGRAAMICTDKLSPVGAGRTLILHL